MALGLLAGAALTAHPAQAVDAVGPYYALPAWDRKMEAATRFVVLTNWASQAVLDKETGLVWERSPAALGSGWDTARKVCTALTTGGHKGWRLPSIVELTSVIDLSVAAPGPTLPPGHPFLTVEGFYYWSATTETGLADNVWGVGFGTGNVLARDKLCDDCPRTWCVRGGMNADAY
jgi:hypothetical protein